MSQPEGRPWFTEEDVDYYVNFLASPSGGEHESFRTLLATVSEVLGETDFDALLSKLVQHALGTTHAERGILLLLEKGQLVTHVALDAEGNDLGIDPPMAHTVADGVCREGAPVIKSVNDQHQVLDLSHSAASLRLRQVMCAPLRARGKILGVIYVDSTLRGPPLTENDLRLFHAQAGLMGLAVENHRLFREAWEARDMQRQVKVAREIQEKLYPAAPWLAGPMEFAGLNEISAQVGGDYYDYLSIDGERAALGIGDVSGHGIGPALIMSDVRARLRSTLHSTATLGGVYGVMNQALCEELVDGMYVSLFIAVYNPAQRTLEYQNAGHVPPLLYHPESDTLTPITANAPALGLFDEFSAGPCPTITIKPGSYLVCYTDGITDRPNDADEFYSSSRLEDLVRRAAQPGTSAADVAEAIRADSHAFASGRPLRDDLTVLVARFD